MRRSVPVTVIRQVIVAAGLVLLPSFFVARACAYEIEIEWERAYGGADSDYAYGDWEAM